MSHRGGWHRDARRREGGDEAGSGRRDLPGPARPLPHHKQPYMSENAKSTCPECEGAELDRRDFIRTVGAGTAVVAVAAIAPRRSAEVKKDEDPSTSVKKTEKPAEAPIKERFPGLAGEQKQAGVH